MGASENLGMVMIFTLTSAAQEWIVQYCEDREKRLKDEEEARKTKEEEEERKRFEGTVVTVETFFAWKAKFDNERLAKKKTKDDKISGKLTGKELFSQDITLNE